MDRLGKKSTAYYGVMNLDESCIRLKIWREREKQASERGPYHEGLSHAQFHERATERTSETCDGLTQLPHKGSKAQALQIETHVILYMIVWELSMVEWTLYISSSYQSCERDEFLYVSHLVDEETAIIRRKKRDAERGWTFLAQTFQDRFPIPTSRHHLQYL